MAGRRNMPISTLRHPDILWRNNSTGGNLVWFMNGTTYLSAKAINTVANTAWQIRAAQ